MGNGYCNYGKVIYKYKIPKGRCRDYYIVVQVDDNVLKFDKYTKYEYYNLNINDDVIVLSAFSKSLLTLLISPDNSCLSIAFK